MQRLRKDPKRKLMARLEIEELMQTSKTQISMKACDLPDQSNSGTCIASVGVKSRC